MTTGQRIKDLRKQLGLSAEYLSKELGVSPATVYRYEKGDIEKVPGSVLEPLAQLLHTTPAYLMGWDDIPDSSYTSEERRLVSAWRMATEKEKELVAFTLKDYGMTYAPKIKKAE